MTKTLRAWRAEQLLSTRRIASLSGTSNKTIVQIENGRQTPTFATIEKISRVLQVDPREISEFSIALAERARPSFLREPIAPSLNRARQHLLCVSAVASFLTVSRRLLETERFSVTTMIDMPVSVERVACLQPDVVIVDLGAEAPHMHDLLRQLLSGSATRRLPIVATGRDRRRLEEIVAGLDDAARQRVTIAPFGRDLREIVTAVESLTGASEMAGQVAEPPE